MSSSSAKKLPAFYVQTYSGHLLKTSTEIMKSYIVDRCWLSMNDNGMILEGTSSDGKITKNMEFFDFEKLICKKEQTVSIDIQSLYRILKGCKKKAVVTIKLKDEDSEKLNIDTSCVKTDIHINRGRVVKINPPTGYSDGEPCIIPSAEFHTMCKELLQTQARKIMLTQNEDGSIKFSAGFDKAYTRNAELGFKKRISYAEKESTSQKGKKGKTKKPSKTPKTSIYEVFSQTYNMRDITRIMKATSMSKNIKIYMHKNLPLKIVYDIDTLGKATMYISQLEQATSATILDDDTTTSPANGEEEYEDYIEDE